MLNAPQDTGEIEYRRVAPSGLNSPEMIKLRKKWALACFAVILGITLYKGDPRVETYVDERFNAFSELASNPSRLLTELLGSDE